MDGVFMRCLRKSEGDLQSREHGLFVFAVRTCGGPALELRVQVIEDQLQVAGEVPVDAQRPCLGASRGYRRIGEQWERTLIDLQFATMWIPPIRIHDPDKLAIVMDHAVPAPTIKDAAGGPHARKFASDFGIKHFFDVGRHGICHQIIAENGLARPGEVLACTDSHTCAAGAYNTAARGLGPAEVYSIMCTGTTWYQICLLYTSPSPRDLSTSRMPSSA